MPRFELCPVRGGGMYKEHSCVEKPTNENAKIWRYLDFTKFISLLDRRALFFCRADKLSDPFEGSFSEANLELRLEIHKSMPERIPERMQRSYYPLLKEVKKVICINSWHVNEYEYEAMWKLYLKSEEGVAIQSTCKRLRESFNNLIGNEIHIGKVKYTDYRAELVREGHPLFPFFHKRKSFEYERELRAVIQNFPMPPYQPEFDKIARQIGDGKYVSVDLDVLIEKIFVSPKAPEWFRELVKSMVARYNVKKEVSQSSLSNDPIY